MVHLETLRSSLASTTDSAHWLSLVCSGPKSAMLLLRELELGANDPTTRDLGTRLFHAVEATFDQYTGLRQIADFRGLPDAPFELSEAIQVRVECKLQVPLSHCVCVCAAHRPHLRAHTRDWAADVGESGVSGRDASFAGL